VCRLIVADPAHLRIITQTFGTSLKPLTAAR
jgi:hypothetical protein